MVSPKTIPITKLGNAWVREVVACQGRGVWAYRQHFWPLQVSALTQGDGGCGASAWARLHFEFDWGTSLCAALDHGDCHIEGPLQLEWQPGFGTEPTANMLKIQIAPSMQVGLANLLLG